MHIELKIYQVCAPEKNLKFWVLKFRLDDETVDFRCLSIWRHFISAVFYENCSKLGELLIMILK